MSEYIREECKNCRHWSDEPMTFTDEDLEESYEMNCEIFPRCVFKKDVEDSHICNPRLLAPNDTNTLGNPNILGDCWWNK